MNRESELIPSLYIPLSVSRNEMRQCIQLHLHFVPFHHLALFLSQTKNIFFPLLLLLRYILFRLTVFFILYLKRYTHIEGVRERENERETNTHLFGSFASSG